jgi:hypothetical protein
MNRAEDWQRCLFAAADLQLGSPLNLSIPKSAAAADIRTALLAKGLTNAGDEQQTSEDGQQTLKLAIRELQSELNCDRAALRLAALEWVLNTVTPVVNGKNIAPSAKGNGQLSRRDAQVHEIVGRDRFCNFTNAEILRHPALKKRLQVDYKLNESNAAKKCFDRIRLAKGYRLSREIAKKRSSQ